MKNRNRNKKSSDGSSESIEHQKLELDRARLHLEKRRLDVERRVLHKHFGAIATALVTFFAAIFTAGQLYLKHAADERRSEEEFLRVERELRQEEAESNRAWNLDLATYVTENQDLIFSADEEKRLRIRGLLLVLFPSEVTKPLFARLEATSVADRGKIWAEGRAVADRLSAPSIYETSSTSKLQHCAGPDLILIFTLHGFEVGMAEHAAEEYFLSVIQDWMERSLGEGATLDSITITGHSEDIFLDSRRGSTSQDLALERAQKVAEGLTVLVDRSSLTRPNVAVSSREFALGPESRRVDVRVRLKGGCG